MCSKASNCPFCNSPAWTCRHFSSCLPLLEQHISQKGYVTQPVLHFSAWCQVKQKKPHWSVNANVTQMKYSNASMNMGEDTGVWNTVCKCAWSKTINPLNISVCFATYSYIYEQCKTLFRLPFFQEQLPSAIIIENYDFRLLIKFYPLNFSYTIVHINNCPLESLWQRKYCTRTARR